MRNGEEVISGISGLLGARSLGLATSSTGKKRDSFVEVRRRRAASRGHGPR